MYVCMYGVGGSGGEHVAGSYVWGHSRVKGREGWRRVG